MIPNSEATVKFLTYIFHEDIEMMAKILLAQAEDKPGELVDMLKGVKDFIDTLIQDIQP